MTASSPNPADWDQIAARLRAEPGATDAMGEALEGLRREGEADRALRRIEALAQEQPHERHLFLLSETFHRLGRFTSADEALRLVRRRGLDAAGLNEFSKRHRPRVAERRRFYRCDRECGIEGRRVAEVGGQLPPEFVRAARPRSWTSVSLAVSAGIAEPGFRGVLGDAARLPLRDEGYDLVFSSSAFEHIGDLAGALAEIRRILAPGGALFSHFSPIWSSAEGHHLRGGPLENLRDAGLWPLAPWEHLTTTPGRMKERLAARIPAEEARRVVHHVYGRSSLNRLFYEDYVHLFHASGLAVDRLELLKGPEPDGDTLARLEKRHPGRGRWDVNGMWIVLHKEG